jgi:hypothetical protein
MMRAACAIGQSELARLDQGPRPAEEGVKPEFHLLGEGIVIGEVEPTSYIDGEPGWQVDLQEWAAEFRSAMETPLAFMQVDVQWDQPDAVENASVFYKFSQQLQRQGLLRSREGATRREMTVSSTCSPWQVEQPGRRCCSTRSAS